MKRRKVREREGGKGRRGEERREAEAAFRRGMNTEKAQAGEDTEILGVGGTGYPGERPGQQIYYTGAFKEHARAERRLAAL